MSPLLLSCLFLVALHLAAPAVGEDAFREDFATTSAWEARPDWLGAPAAHPVLEAADGIAHLAIREPERGMKWRRDLEPVDTEFTPWLVIRYRATGYAADRVDYLLWLDNAAQGRDGGRLIVGPTIKADGQWHTLALNLPECGVVPPVSAMALQCFATAEGDAHLWVDSIVITDTPPEDAEGLEALEREPQSWPVPMQAAEVWTVQPRWLGNYGERNSVRQTEAGTQFMVDEAGWGAKWSRILDEPIVGPTWVAMRYRATGLQTSADYALYIAAEPGGMVRDEQYVIRLNDLTPDGMWHVAICPVKIPSVKTLAIQVQATRDDAALEVADITFHDRKPVVRLEEVFAPEAGWPAELGAFRPVALPAGNLEGAQLSRKLGYQGSLAPGKVRLGGVPFELRSGTGAALMTPRTDLGEIQVPLSGSAAEIYLILAAQLPSAEEPSYGGGSMNSIRQVERLVARIDYADGTSEEQFPFCVPAERHAVTRGLGLYSLALEPGKALKSLTLRDGMRNGAFGLVAATLSSEPGPATAATEPQAAPSPPRERPVEARAARITALDRGLHIDAWTVAMTLDWKQGLRVIAVRNHSAVDAPLQIKPGPLFRIESGDLKLTSEDFTVTGTTKDGEETRLELLCDRVTPAIRVSLTVDVVTPPEIGLRATCDLGGRDPSATHFYFPELSGLSFSDSAEDNWLWSPARGDIITNASTSLRLAYAGAGNPFQVIGAFGKPQGTGLYIMTQDMNAVPRLYHLQKSGGAMRLAVEYWPCSGGELPRTVIGCNQGDWHQQLERYREWALSWYKPAAPRKQWFRDVFSFRQQFMHFTLPTRSGMFDPETKTINLKGIVEQDAEAFGGVDYLHLFDWGWDPVHGRCGDYIPWDYLGGAEKFRAAVEEVKAMGIPVGLYIEGYLVDPQSDLGKAHGAQWQLLDAGGKPYTYFDPSFNICSWVKDWQDYLSATYARARAQTGAVGFYIDEYGFSNLSHLCYNPGHGHAIPASPVLGEREMTRRVREALGPDAAIYTEESPTDVNSQFQDGSFTYNISSVSDDLSPSHINLYRFAFPDFKTIEIITCDRPLGSNVEAVNRILFNGEAIWIEGIWDRWFTPEVRAAIARNHTVMRANRQCFAGDYPRPLMPTLREGVYANEFAQNADGTGKTCWTLYNTNFRSARGELLAVRHLPGSRYTDELTGKELSVRAEGETAYLSLDLGPRAVGVVSRTTGDGDQALGIGQ